jgi:hypothetical protein
VKGGIAKPRTYRENARRDYLNSEQQEQADRAQRNAIEGSFGIGKRRYGLGRIMMKLKETGETSISLIILVMNFKEAIKASFGLII